MKTLLTVLVILALTGIAQGEWKVGGHNWKQGAVISLTAVGAVSTARFAANLLPIKKPEHKIVARAILGFASGYVLLNIADRMHRPGVEANHFDMHHACKDGACLTGNIVFALSVWDTWRLFKAEKKK
jgi:hypothetical protein